MRFGRRKPLLLPRHLRNRFNGVDEALNFSMDELLGLPIEEQMALSEFYKLVLKKGSRQQKENVAQKKGLHLRQYKQIAPAVRENIIGLVKKLQNGDRDILLQEGGVKEWTMGHVDWDDYVDQLPSFEERFKGMPVRRLRNQKEQFRVSNPLPIYSDGKPLVLTSFIEHFKDEKKKRQAEAGQMLYHYFVARIGDLGIEADLFDRFVPIRPSFSDDKTLGNYFFQDVESLYDTFKDCSDDAKLDHLVNLGKIDGLLAQAEPTVVRMIDGERDGSSLGEILKGSVLAGIRSLPVIDHTQQFYDKFVYKLDPSLRKKLEKDDEAMESFARVVDLLGIEKTKGRKTLSHGDMIPANILLVGDEQKYVPIDFEYTCQDHFEAALVQRMVKSGIYDHMGKSREYYGESMEDLVLDSVGRTLKRQDDSFDVEAMKDRFQRLKLENYLLWAGRHAEFSQSESLENRREHSIFSQFYYTLFFDGMRKLDPEVNLDALGVLLAESLGQTNICIMPEDEMEMVHKHDNPSGSIYSLFEFDKDASKKEIVDDIIDAHERAQRRDALKRIALGTVGLVGLSAGGVSLYRAQTAERQKKMAELDRIWGEYYPITRPKSESFGISRDDPKLKQIMEKLPDLHDSAAAYYMHDDPQRGVEIIKFVQSLSDESDQFDYFAYLPRRVLHKSFDGSGIMADNWAMQWYQKVRTRLEKKCSSSNDPIIRHVQLLRDKTYREIYPDQFHYQYFSMGVQYNMTLSAVMQDIKEGKLAEGDLLNQDFIDSTIDGRVDADFVRAILKANTDYTSLDRMDRYNQIQGLDVERYTVGRTPRENFELAVTRLTDVLKKYEIDPLDPTKAEKGEPIHRLRDYPIKLERALFEYLLNDFKFGMVQDLAKKRNAEQWENLAPKDTEMFTSSVRLHYDNLKQDR